MKKLIFISLFMSAIAAQAQVNVLSNGNMGVGTATPSAKFNVIESNESATQTNFQHDVQYAGYLLSTDYTDGAFTPGFFWQTGNDNPGKPKAGIYLKETGSGTSMYFGTSNAPATGITNNGLVITPSGTLQSSQGTATTPTYSFTGAPNTGMFSIGSTILNFSTSGVERMRINATGHVVIGGTTSPTWLFSVYGTTYCSSGQWDASDSQFKQNITAIDAPIEKLNQLNGKRYSYNTTAFPGMNFPNGFTYGVIAQEVQAVLPELVQADSAGYLAVNYTGLIPVIIEAVKTQQQTIKAQEIRINTLETDLANCCATGSAIKSDNKTGDNNNALKTTSAQSAYLLQNIPNPFTAKTTIRYYIPEQTNNASLLIFDMQGKLIKTYPVNSRKDGYTEINGGEMQPGMYMYSLIIDGKEIDTKRMILTN